MEKGAEIYKIPNPAKNFRIYNSTEPHHLQRVVLVNPARPRPAGNRHTAQLSVMVAAEGNLCPATGLWRLWCRETKAFASSSSMCRISLVKTPPCFCQRAA